MNLETGFQPDTQAAVTNLEDTISRLSTLRGFVWDMLNLEGNARTADASTIATYAKKFDFTIRSLNTVADEIIIPPNLIGSTFATDLSYIINALGDRKSTSYVDMSTGYSILDGGGNVWKKDSYANSGTLAQYDQNEVLTGKTVEVTRALQLDSLSGSTVNFTINPGTVTQESFTGGVLSTTGLNIVDSWAYASLSTTEGRARAETALRSALTMIDVQSAALNGSLARAKFDLGLSEVSSNGASSKISSLNQAKLLSLQEAAYASSRESDASVAAITRNTILLQAYQYMFDVAVIGNQTNETSLSSNKINKTTRIGGLLSLSA